MLDSGSSDFLTRTAVALHAAIRNEADLLALLPATPDTPVKSISPRSEIAEPALAG
jgi:hypothetical protein